MLIMRDVILILLCVGAGTIGGVFFAFSTFVMRALTCLPASQGVAAMQRINVVVLNPMFLGTFISTAVLGVAAAIVAVIDWEFPASPLQITASLLYCVGSFLVTIMFNVPRNERLAKLPPESPEAQAYWSRYVNEWLMWNHVRMIASTLAVTFAAVALAV
jgi:uncharacterized membrane protein